MTGRFIRAAAFGLLLLLAAPAVEAAPAPQAVADALTAAIAATGRATLAYGGVSGSGDSVTLSAVKLTSAGGHEVVSVPALILTGVADRQPGGFTAAGVAFDQGNATSRGKTTTWATAALTGVVIPTPDEVKSQATYRPFASAAIATLAFSGADIATPVEVASVTADVGDIVAGAPGSIRVHLAGIKLPMDLAANSVAGTVVGMLNYKTLTADVTMDSAYDTGAHTATLNGLVIDVTDVGKITISAKASGLSVGALADKDSAPAARSAARLDALSVRIDNAGVVERLLDMQAQMLGGTRADVKTQIIGGALPFALSFIDNAAFRDQFMAAMTTFLNDPHSFTVTFAPASPVPLGEVMRTALHRPGTLPDLLSPTVQANN